MALQKTNAARLLDAAGISYTLVPYEVDEEHLEASHVAEELGEDLDRVFKTLVLRGDRNGLFVCVMPGSLEVDLRVAARISGNKNCDMIHVKELLPLTGYIRGGCSPIGMKKPLPTYVHESALLYDTIYVSAGVRGLQLCLSPQDLISFVGAGIYPI
jgi:Cys-tRNA(Pro)/Cys-tRNA(Cys) deacylase